MIRRTKRWMVFLLLVLIAVSLSSAACATKEPQEAVEIRVRLGYFLKPRNAPLYLAIEKGYFAEEGINPVISEGSGSTDSVVLTAAGEYDIAESSPDAVIVGLAEGTPIKAISIIQQRNPLAMIALQSSGITIPKDIEGKKVGIRPAGSSYLQWKLFAALNDIDLATVQEITVGFDEAGLLAGEVDLTPVYTSRARATTEDAAGQPIVYFLFKDYPELDTYGNVWIVHTGFAKEHPDLVRGFLKAFHRGLADMLQDPEAAIDVLLTVRPELQKDTLLKEALAEIEDMVSADTKKYGLGYASEEKWARSLDLNLEGGFIEQKMPLEDVFTNEYLIKVSEP